MKMIVGISAILATAVLADNAPDPSLSIFEARAKLETRLDSLRPVLTNENAKADQQLAQWGNWGNWQNWNNWANW